VAFEIPSLVDFLYFSYYFLFVMKLMLVIPPNYTYRFSYPHLGIMYLYNVLREDGHHVDILDCQTTSDYMEKLASPGKYDFIGFYMNYFSVGLVREMASKLRVSNPEVRIIVGGPSANYKPEKFVGSFADIVVLGEGEQAIKAIACGEELSGIPSIVYRLPDGKIVENKKSSTWVDLDSIPFPDWNLVDYRKYGYTFVKKKPVVSIMTSRGCPNRCIYCTKLIHGHEMRMRSVQNVADEIENDHAVFDVSEIHFMDDNLTISLPRFKGICEEIIRRGLNRKVNFGIPSGIRPDTGDQEMFDLMARAGFYFTVIAIESADATVSAKLRRGIDLSRVQETIRLARRSGLIVSTFYIFGTPFDTLATMRKSADFACRSNANILSIFFLLPFPGTDVYDMLVKEEKLEPETSEMGLNYIEMKPVFEANDWTKDDLIALTKRAYRRFYLSPGRILMNLFSLPKTFRNPFVLFVMLLKLFIHGTPVFERRQQRIEK